MINVLINGLVLIYDVLRKFQKNFTMKIKMENKIKELLWKIRYYIKKDVTFVIL
jgi:hypothetical protein